MEDGQRFVLAKGGRGGRGNAVFKSSTHQAPREFEYGEPGEQLGVELELKTLADVGLGGFDLPQGAGDVPAPVLADAKGAYPQPEPGVKKNREY